MQKIIIDGKFFDIDHHPDECPHCHHAIKPLYVASISHDSGIDAAFKCPRHDCSRMFIAAYRKTMQSTLEYSKHFMLRGLFPRNPVAPSVPVEVANISPQFVEIFTQASKAEVFGLEAVAGVGYRKALEFLVKDYCVTKYPDKEDEVKKRPLGQIVDVYVDNENIKQCAKRAVWLGNDETHYVRTWIDKDIQHLKRLIKLTVGWIEQAIVTEMLMQDMQKQ